MEILRSIAAFFRRLFRGNRTAHKSSSLTAPAAVQSQVLNKQKPRTAHEKRRAELRQMLGQTDGGGKHYGSKRRGSQHRGSGRGKRSGRQ